jgi:hypothetical protein
VLTGETFATPDGRNFVIFYRTPFMGEYAPGDRGAIIVNRFQLSDFYNCVGFAHYKQKNYNSALGYFDLSHFYDEENPKVLYNIACMNALNADVDRVIEYLTYLEHLKTEQAARLLMQVQKDSDFSRIRNNREFKEFLETIRY